MQAEKILYLSVADYLAYETGSEQRHEYLNGELVAMTGASEAHNIIALNLAMALHQHLQNSPWRVYMSDMKLEVAAANCFFYPDLMVVCAEQGNPQQRYHFSDATVVVEIVSPSTAQRDREFKRISYQRLLGLQEYLLIEQGMCAVTLYRRLCDGWERCVYGAAEVLDIRSIDLALPLAAVYAGLSI